MILFNKDKDDKICRLINFQMDAGGLDWKRSNKSEDDPVVKNPEKKQSIFINAFQIDDQVLIITKFRTLVYDSDLKSEVKAIKFEEYGPNKEFQRVFSFNESFNMRNA